MGMAIAERGDYSTAKTIRRGPSWGGALTGGGHMLGNSSESES